MSDKIANVAIVALTLCGITSTAVLVHRGTAAPSSASSAARTVANWREYAMSGHREGPPTPDVTLTAFVDFQCPVCGAMHKEIPQLLAEYPGRLAIIYRHYPLVQLHPYSMAAALASECADAQGHFWSFADAVYHQQGLLGHRGWSAFARDAHVPDLKAFGKCVRQQTFKNKVEADIAAGDTLRIDGTPTILLNQEEILGVPRGGLRDLVDSVLRAARP